MAKERALAQKYHSLDTLDKKSKAEALKDPNLNPYRLSDPYDGLANSFERWKTVAKQANNGSFSYPEMGKIASNYYDKMIGPLYGGLHQNDPSVTPMSRELFLKQAYGEALNYNIENAYNSSAIHDMKHGWHEGMPSLIRGSEFLYNAAGNLLSGAIQNWRRERSLSTDQQVHEMGSALSKPWYEQGKSIVNNLADVTKERDNNVTKGAHIQTDNQDFWAQSVPAYGGFLNKATSFVVEQAPSLPFFELGGPTKNLTSSLVTSKAGKWALGTLMAGTEGLAYETATRKQKDKIQAWQGAVGFIIFHNIFEVGGLGLKKLGDIADGALKARVDKTAARLDLAQKGERPATGPERYDQHVEHEANVMTLTGIPGVQAKFTQALHYLSDMEGRGWSKDQIKDHELRLRNADPARFIPLLTSAKYVRSLLAVIGKPLGAILPGSEDEKFLSSRIAQLILDAADKIHSTKAAEEGAQAQVEGVAKDPAAKHTFDFYKAKAMSQIAKENPTDAKMMKPEEVEAYAKKLMAQDTAKAAKIAAAKLTKNPVEEATSIAKRAKTSAEKAAKDTAPLKIKSSYKEDKFGQPSASFRADKDYKVRLDAYKANAKRYGKTLSQFFEGMDDSDFKADLAQHFYPKALKNAEVFFESMNTKEGAQDPNFLAFMYNYVHEMPREFGKELENRLSETMKVQKYMNGRKPTEPQLEYYAGAMYNHVDNFLGSGRWPKEYNIFRSSNEDMFNSTRWQLKLLREKQVQERKNLTDMFSGNKTAQRNAMTTYRTLAKKRTEQYMIGPKDMSSQKRIKDYDDQIASHQTQTGRYERWNF